MNITAQSVRPKTRANVSSSVMLGSGKLPGWVWTQIRAELLGPAAQVHLPVEEVGHGLVVEGHRGPGAYLPHKLDVLDVEQVVGRGDAEAADLGVAQVAQEEQLRPGGGTEPQGWARLATPGSGPRHGDRLVVRALF